MTRFRFLLLLAAVPLLAQSPVAIVLDPTGNFRVTGWPDAAKLSPAQWSEVLSVQVDIPNVPPLLGSYRMEQGVLVFVPQYPVQPGVNYRATLKIPGQQTLVQRFALPKDSTPTTVVEHVYPTTNVLPENQLKFYI